MAPRHGADQGARAVLRLRCRREGLRGRPIGLPSGLSRLGYAPGRRDRPLSLPKTSTEYFQRQCFISCDPAEKGIPAFASNYPHPGGPADDVVGAIANRPELSEESKRRILAVNAQRCLGFT